MSFGISFILFITSFLLLFWSFCISSSHQYVSFCEEKGYLYFKRNIGWTVPLHCISVTASQCDYSVLSIVLFVPISRSHSMHYYSNFKLFIVSPMPSLAYFPVDPYPLKLPCGKILSIHWTVTEQSHCCECLLILLPWELSTKFSCLFSPGIFAAAKTVFFSPQNSSLYEYICFPSTVIKCSILN